MAIEQIDIEAFLELLNQYPVFDVRSPAEFSHAHIPGAIPLPLFTDDQRKIIGTAYKEQGRQIAVKIGLDFFSGRMKLISDELEELCKSWQKTYAREEPRPPQTNCTASLLAGWNAKRGGCMATEFVWPQSLYAQGRL